MNQEQLIEEIMDAFQHIRDNRSRINSKREEASSGRGSVLRYLYAHEGTASPSELCAYMQVTTPRVTVVLNELEKERLITRATADYDHRRICVNLTEEGRMHVELWQANKRTQIRQLVDRIGGEDALALLRICHAIEESGNSCR